MISPAMAAAVDPLVEGAGNILLSQGVLGLAVIGLVYYVFVLRRDLKDLATATKADIAAKDALINTLQEARLAEAKVGFDAVRSTQSALEALSVALRSKGP